MAKTIKWGCVAIVSPLAIILLVAVALYVPPIQNWVVHIASKNASEAVGMDISVERVRLAFPLDLSVEGVQVVKQNDSLLQQKDTIAYVKRAVLDVQLLPLFYSNMRVNAMELIGMRINTVDFIPQARIKGDIGRLLFDDGIPVAAINFNHYTVALREAMLYDTHLDVALKDSVPKDTTTSENFWQIKFGGLQISNSDVLLHMPNDTLQVRLSLNNLIARNGNFDLHRGLYELACCKVADSSIQYDNNLAYRIPYNGLDVNHISLNDVNVKIDSLHFLDSQLTMKIKSMSMKEKSGLTLNSLIADVTLDSTKIAVKGVLKTPSSFLATRLSMDLNAFGSHTMRHGKIKAAVNASLSKRDMMLMMADRSINKLWPDRPLCIKGEMEGNLQNVYIPNLSIEMPTVFSVNANGKASGFMDIVDNPYSDRFSATLHADLNTQDLSALASLMPPHINLPRTHTVFDARIKGAEYNVDINAKEKKGCLNAKASVNLEKKAYYADVNIRDLNLSHFLKDMHLGTFTGAVTLSGKGTDVMSRHTWMKAVANIERLDYANYNINNVKANISLKDGRAMADLDSHNRLVDGKIKFDALLNAKKLDATFITELCYVDLYHLNLVDKPLKVAACTHVDMMSDFGNNHFLQGTISDISLTDSAKTYRPDDIALDIQTNCDTTIAIVDCGDFSLKMNAQGGYRHLVGRSDRLLEVMKTQFEHRAIDQYELRKVLPKMNLSLHSSKDNPIYRFIKYYNFDYDEINATIKTSFEEGINANVLMTGVSTQGYKLDTISLKVNSSNNPYTMAYTGYVRNVKPNNNIFRVLFDGNVMEHGISLNTSFYDADNIMGLKLGMEATMVEEGLKFHLTPERPVIAYENFNLGKDNYVLLDRNNRLFANVTLLADNGTGIQLYSTSTENNADDLQDITLSVTNLNIGYLLTAIPYAPRVEGVFNGDVHFVQEKDLSFSISSSIRTKNLIYEGCQVGNLGTELVYMPKNDGSHHIDGILSLDDKEIGSIKGSYNFNTSQIDADMKYDRFPMRIINGFVPDRIVGLEGYADGVLTIHGATQTPLVNGELYLESSSLISVPYGVKMRFDDDPIRIVDSKLLFENFQVYANNNQPLTSYGSLDFSNMNHIKMDLLMRAENFLLIDSKETRRSEAYGKAYVNFYASLKGELDQLQVKGKVDVLPTTNIFYILHDSPLSEDSRMKELVTFTDLHANDRMEAIKPTVDGLKIGINFNVMNGSHIKCWLNDARSNYLDIIGEGDLRWKYDNNTMSMQGKYTISEGEIKYSLPVIPLKTFIISNGSYMEFTGDMMNPKLHITAKETKKASVNLNGTNRMVTFNTGVILSKKLNDMGLEFTIEAPEDNTITDELNMMSKEERGKLAVTMLTTGIYLSDGNTSTFSMNSALNSFLQSEISNIAGSALKTIDLSFGMDNSTEEDGTMHTDYSFKFAKRFWNNRLSISVGGKISTGPDVSGQNKSFFDNVEVQYRMSDVSNKYLNLFYHRSVFDFLEGYVGQYGGGFLWKKKIQNMKEIFHSTQRQTSLPAPVSEKTDSVSNK